MRSCREINSSIDSTEVSQRPEVAQVGCTSSHLHGANIKVACCLRTSSMMAADVDDLLVWPTGLTGVCGGVCRVTHQLRRQQPAQAARTSMCMPRSYSTGAISSTSALSWQPDPKRSSSASLRLDSLFAITVSSAN